MAEVESSIATETTAKETPVCTHAIIQSSRTTPSDFTPNRLRHLLTPARVLRIPTHHCKVQGMVRVPPRRALSEIIRRGRIDGETAKDDGETRGEAEASRGEEDAE